MLKTKRQQITVCVSCRHAGHEYRPGRALIERLKQALNAADPVCASAFEISGVACMAGCDRPCTVAYHGAQKATYLFGDIDPDKHIDDLIAFAKQYRDLEDGWCSSSSRPKGLSGKTLARVPASMIVTETQKGPLR
jgi:predicted metal-binding protein